jgi:hypothetical protein
LDLTPAQVNTMLGIAFPIPNSSLDYMPAHTIKANLGGASAQPVDYTTDNLFFGFNVPYLAAYAGTVHVVNNTWNKLNFALYFDSRGWWSGGFFRYNPLQSGKYLCIFTCTVQISAASDAYTLYTTIAFNGGMVGPHAGHSWNGLNPLGNMMTNTAVSILSCNGTTDYIEPYCYPSSGSDDLNVVGGFTSLVIFRVGS